MLGLAEMHGVTEMHGVNWGDVPTWVASVLTGGSLLLGFSILLRDRRRMDRSQIDQFAFWVEGDKSDRHTARILIHVKNASALPVKGVTIGASANVHYDGLTFVAKFTAEKVWDVLGPGISDDYESSFSPAQQAASLGLTLDPDRTSIDYVTAMPEYAYLQDNSGRPWAMDNKEVLRRTRRTSVSSKAR
jgi:hypothetical protein